MDDGGGLAQGRALRTRLRSILTWLALTWLLPGGLTLLAYLRLEANRSSACGGEPTCVAAQTWLFFMLWLWGLALFFVIGLVGAIVIAVRPPQPSQD